MKVWPQGFEWKIREVRRRRQWAGRRPTEARTSLKPIRATKIDDDEIFTVRRDRLRSSSS